MLEPIILIIYIIDLESGLKSTISKFIDDIYCGIAYVKYCDWVVGPLIV